MTTTRPEFYPFRSERAKMEYERHGRELTRAWPVRSETVLLDTPSGRTFVRASGSAGDPPLVLLPGARISSLMWIDMIAALAARHRTYALDIIGDAGLSVNRSAVSKPSDDVDWLDEVLTLLVPDGAASLAGVSLGGSIAAQYALRHPGRVRAVALLAPGGTVLPLSLGFFVRITLITLLPGMGGSLRRVCRWLFEDAVRGDEACRARLERAIEELETVVRVFALPRPPWPAVLTDQEWRSFRAPCLFLVGEHERIYSAPAAVRRLSRVAPQVKAEVLRGAGHDLTIVDPDRVTDRVLAFLAEHEVVRNAPLAMAT
jgi:pimeloyl-ACP methyl ester carboxylesterase